MVGYITHRFVSLLSDKIMNVTTVTLSFNYMVMRCGKVSDRMDEQTVTPGVVETIILRICLHGWRIQ